MQQPGQRRVTDGHRRGALQAGEDQIVREDGLGPRLRLRGKVGGGRKQPEAAQVLAYIAELVGDFAPPHEANDKLYRMVKASVEALATSSDTSNQVMRYFEVWLLRLAGLFPELETCAECNSHFRDDESIYLDADARTRCHKCGGRFGTVLSAATRRAVIATKKVGPLEFADVADKLSAKDQTQFAEFTHRLLVRALERRPRTAIALAH